MIYTSGSIIKNFITFLIMLMYFIVTFRVFAYVPVGLIEDITTILFVFILLAFYVFELYVDFSKKRTTLIHLVILPILFIPFFNCIQAKIVYDQPVIFGLLAQRTNFLILVAAFNVFLLKNSIITLKQIEFYFLITTHFCLVIFFYYNLFVDPLKYLDTELVSFSVTRGYRFKFSNILVNALMFYCIFQIWVNRIRIYYLSLIVCVFYTIVYVQDRSQLVAIAATLLLYYLRNFSIRKKIFYAISIITGVVIIFLLLYWFFPDLINIYIQLYTNASSILTGDSASDASTNLRITESRIALDGFKEHPLMGTGFVSRQWNGGYNAIYNYFYPSDVGILGNLFIFGIIGTLIYYLLFIFSYWFSRPLRKNPDVFLITCQYSMVFLFIDMFTVASNIKYIGIIAFFVSMIYYYRFYQNNQSESLN